MFSFSFSKRNYLGKSPLPTTYKQLFLALTHSPGFWIPRLGLRIPGIDSGSLTVGLRFTNPVVSGITDSLSCIQDSKVKDSGFQKHKFRGILNPDSLTWENVFVIGESDKVRLLCSRYWDNHDSAKTGNVTLKTGKGNKGNYHRNSLIALLVDIKGSRHFGTIQNSLGLV